MVAIGSLPNRVRCCAHASARPFVCVDATSEDSLIWVLLGVVPRENRPPGAGGPGERGNGHDQFN